MGIILTEEILDEVEFNEYIDSILDDEEIINENNLKYERSLRLCEKPDNKSKIPTMKGLILYIGNNERHEYPRIKVAKSGTNPSVFRNKHSEYDEVYIKNHIDPNGTEDINLFYKDNSNNESLIPKIINKKQEDEVKEFFRRNGEILWSCTGSSSTNYSIDRICKDIIRNEVEYAKRTK